VHVKKLATDPRAVVDHFSDRMRRHVTRLTGGRVTPPSRDGAQIAAIDLLRDELFRAATEAYDKVVQPYDGKVVLFQSRDGTGSETEKVDWDRGWSGLVPSSTAMHPIAGTHLQILQEPGVFDIARVLRQHLRDIDERPPMRRTRRASSARIAPPPGRPTPTDI
jgi:thioesterase domain-containing protein